MKTKRQINFGKIEKYIFNAMDFEGRECNPQTNFDKLKAIHSFFISEHWFDNNVRKFKGNEANGFADWLQGAPSCLNIDLFYVDILKTAKDWNFDVSTEKKEDAFCASWYNRISVSFFFLLNRETRLNNKPKKEKKAFKPVKFSFAK